MITVSQKGEFKHSINYLKKISETRWETILDKYGKRGVDALRSATPVDTGVTAKSWGYKIINKRDYISLEFHNTSSNDGVPIAVILQYGHGTGTGGWVHGKDYINPAIAPIFEKLASEIQKELTRA